MSWRRIRTAGVLPQPIGRLIWLQVSLQCHQHQVMNDDCVEFISKIHTLALSGKLQQERNSTDIGAALALRNVSQSMISDDQDVSGIPHPRLD
jgi:hypothetical protein